MIWHSVFTLSYTYLLPLLGSYFFFFINEMLIYIYFPCYHCYAISLSHLSFHLFINASISHQDRFISTLVQAVLHGRTLYKKKINNKKRLGKYIVDAFC